MAAKKATPLEMDVYFFCRHPKFSYIAANRSVAAFKAGEIKQLSFHQKNLPDEALRLEVELFTNGLADFLFALHFVESSTARMDVRDQLKLPDEPMQKLLNVIAKSFTAA